MSRKSGLLLHLTSLPSRYGIGDLGPSAHAFAKLLHASGQRVWQFLPVNPTAPILGDSPYSSPSAFAGNTLLISPDLLLEEGFATPAEVEEHAHALANASRLAVDFQAVAQARHRLFVAVHARRADSLADDAEFTAFCAENAAWLDDYAAFRVLKGEHQEKAWYDWPDAYARRDPAALDRFASEKRAKLDAVRFFQYLFFRQWKRLRAACEQLGITLMGDVPIYVTHDSADVWARPGYFKLGPRFESTMVAGVPPDYFSKTGQRWGNPVYNWEAMERDGFSWWIDRLRHNLKIAHIIRLDHFRGFSGYWEIPAAEPTAVKGSWVPAPGPALFKILDRALDSFKLCEEEAIDPNDGFDAATPGAEPAPNARYTLHLDIPGLAESSRVRRLPLVAEDLGVITPDVRALIRANNLPGMKVLQFGFAGALAGNPHTPFNHDRQAVVYTGTHDNNTTLAWFAAATEAERTSLENYVGHAVHPENANLVLIRLALASPAETAVIPVQDVLRLGAEARMNTPSTASGNWSWRMRPEHLDPCYYGELKRMTEFYGR